MTIYKGAREAATEININCVGNDGWFAEEEAAEFISKRLAPLVEAAQKVMQSGHGTSGRLLVENHVENELRKALEDLV